MSARAASVERPSAYGTPIVSTASDAGIDAGVSAVSWAAIFAGAAAAAALSFVLIILGFGLGLSSVSPYSAASASAGALGVGTIVWITVTQLAAAGLGGYLAGRLRSRWVRVHTDEVYFRDTAHGFLAWCIASLAAAAFLGSAITSTLNAGLQAGSTVAAGVGAVGVAAGAQDGGVPLGYYVDALFRTEGSHASASATDANASSSEMSMNRSASTGSVSNGSAAIAATGSKTRAEALSIFTHDLRAGSLSSEDKTYLAQVVARETGLAQSDAEKRVAASFDKVKAAEDTAKQDVEKARKAAAYASLWMFVALMCGAFFASLMATLGGKRRDLFV